MKKRACKNVSMKCLSTKIERTLFVLKMLLINRVFFYNKTRVVLSFVKNSPQKKPSSQASEYVLLRTTAIMADPPLG